MKNIAFITSNRAKLMHARHIAEPYGINVLGKKYYGVAYREPRSLDRTELLQKSYEDALRRWTRSSASEDGFFFIEDTSATIHVLSRKREFPGVDIKYWMLATRFEQLDAELKHHGNDRAVSVRSDVLLHLPDWFRQQQGIAESVVHFTGNQRGTIITEPIAIKTNLLYPWLDSKSFNTWFVPEGCSRPLSALSIEIADAHDFRQGSIGGMFEFLARTEALRERTKARSWFGVKFLPNLFPPLLIVTGLPCAGKTTLGMQLSKRYGYYHIEASDFMRRAFYERHGLTSTLSIEAFAESVLQIEPDIVVAPVLREIERGRMELVVITGFRSPKEIEIFQRNYSGPSDLQCLFVDASQTTRFARSRNRARGDALPTLASFRRRDTIQLKMGLNDIRKLLRNHAIKNEGTIREYIETCAKKINATKRLLRLPKLADLHERPSSLEETILLGLALLERRKLRALSTTEIARQLNSLFLDPDFETNKNNVSRYFNFKPSAFYQVETVNGVLRYSLSATGRSRAMHFANAHWAEHESSGRTAES